MMEKNILKVFSASVQDVRVSGGKIDVPWWKPAVATGAPNLHTDRREAQRCIVAVLE
jgi:hypothetical protein